MGRRSVDSATQWRMTAAAAALMLSACGSTVQSLDTVSEGEFGDGVSEDGLSLPTPDADSEEVLSGRTPATTDSFGDGSFGDRPEGPKKTTPRGPIRTGPVDSATGPGAGPGVTRKEIFVGYLTTKGIAAAGESMGVKIDRGDQERIAKAVINDINSRGGVAGRKLVPVFYDVKTESDTSTSAQEACTRWTEDRPVFAAVVPNAAVKDETLSACMSKRKTLLVNATAILRPQWLFSRYAPHLYAPVAPTMERLAPPWIKRLVATDYFGGWDVRLGRPGNAPTKIGIVSNKNFYGDDFIRILRQELGRQSRSATATAGVRADGNVMSDISQAVLRFKQEGVTHVFPQTPGVLILFARAAESQNYRPRYGVSTDSQPNFIQNNVPKEQLAGALGVGWVPTADVDKARDPGDVSAAQKRCRKVMEEAGQDPSKGLTTCDAMNFLVSAIEHGGLSPAEVQRGAHAMGSMPPASTFRISFPRGRFTGASAVRDLAYRDDCSCFAYLTSKNHSM